MNTIASNMILTKCKICGKPLSVETGNFDNQGTLLIHPCSKLCRSPWNPDHKWTTETPTKSGWYWCYNGERRRVVIITDGYIELLENDTLPRYSLEELEKHNPPGTMFWMPCDVPDKPKL